MDTAGQFPRRRLGCVIMASGLSRRFGENKLMVDFWGQPLICGMLNATRGLFARQVVVTRHQEVASFCREQGFDVLFHQLPNRSDTIRLGLESLGDVDGCMFCPGDQPLLKRESVVALIRSWEQDPLSIWRVCFSSTPASPVLFPSWTFSELKNLPDKKGGGWVAAQHPDQVKTLQVSEHCEIMDVDTPADLAALLRHIPPLTTPKGAVHDP